MKYIDSFMVDFPASYVGGTRGRYSICDLHRTQVEGDGQVHQNIILREAQHTPVSHTPGASPETPANDSGIPKHKLSVGGPGYVPGVS